MDPITVRPATGADAGYLAESFDYWGGPIMVAHGDLIDLREQPMLIAWHGAERAGLLGYRPYSADSWEIVALRSTVPGIGAGTALLTEIRALARATGVGRLWLITTNDNTDALRFYQRRGFDIAALHRDAVTKARRDHKPSIPSQVDGIPLRHELELDLAP